MVVAIKNLTGKISVIRFSKYCQFRVYYSTGWIIRYFFKYL